MSSYGEILEDGSLRFVRLLPGPIERVWSWLADGEKRARWLAGGGNARAAGETIRFEFRHADLTVHDETIPENYRALENGVAYDIQVLECDPPHHMKWYWPDEEGMNTEIDIRLSEADGKVKLVLIQRGDVSAEHLVGSTAGWHTHLDIMADKLSGETEQPFWKTHEVFVSEYRTRLGDFLATLGNRV